MSNNSDSTLAISNDNVVSFDDIEAELREYERELREKLGLDEKPKQWNDSRPQKFERSERIHTTILFGGLTVIQDRLIEAGLYSLGYKTKALDCPDNVAMQYGKEFGNRGQCNPTYFTVGNLIKHLIRLRDEEGICSKEIVKNYLFLTSGACGPCRFGMYATEYRKALRDAGFEGFRVILFQNSGGLHQKTIGGGIEFKPMFFITLVKSIIAGDVINAMGYRIRPYEVEAGTTDKALKECKDLVSDALRNKKSVLWALYRCRKVLKQIKVNRLQAKPKVSIIGEFWAMTTEGDGNYHLQRFLEKEGAECYIQLVVNWLYYLIWEAQFNLRESMMLKYKEDAEHSPSESPIKSLFLLRLARHVLTVSLKCFTFAIGLKRYHMPDMDEIARISNEHYLNNIRGGEGHMEVGKLIYTVEHKRAHMVISVKPFGCMPSSGVSDGVQSLITSRYPEANFLAIETSGDGAVNVQSRVQMALFKSRKKAQMEFVAAAKEKGLDIENISVNGDAFKKYNDPLYYAPHSVAGSGANAIYDM